MSRPCAKIRGSFWSSLFASKIDLQLASGPPRTTRTSFGARGNQSSTIPAKLFFVAKATFPPGGLSRILLTIISNSRILSCLKIQQKKERFCAQTAASKRLYWRHLILAHCNAPHLPKAEKRELLWLLGKWRITFERFCLYSSTILNYIVLSNFQ